MSDYITPLSSVGQYWASVLLCLPCPAVLSLTISHSDVSDDSASVFVCLVASSDQV